MNVKKFRFFFVVNVLLLGFVICCNCANNSANEIGNVKESYDSLKENSSLQTSDLILPDKVYLVEAPSDRLDFEEIYLDEGYTYYVHVELVTPHNVTNIDISIWDPDGKRFHVFESKMFYEPEYGRYFDIPFGAVDSGDYNFSFDSVSVQNYNLYVRIEQGPKCLHDKIESPENIISQDCYRFYDGKSINHYKNLETDTSYKIYIGRISAIAITENSEVRLDCTIYDKNDVEYKIYGNALLETVDKVNQFNFGTAISGEYNVKIRIYCSVNYVNVACAIYEDFKISEVQNVNDTKAPISSPNTIEETINEVKSSIPLEWLIGITIFIGIIVAVPCVALLKTRRRSAPDIGIKK